MAIPFCQQVRFVQIEKALRKKETVVDPEEYSQLLRDYGSVHNLNGDNVPVFDWKSETQKCFKATANWHFKYQQCKRFLYTQLKLISWFKLRSTIQVQQIMQNM